MRKSKWPAQPGDTPRPPKEPKSADALFLERQFTKVANRVAYLAGKPVTFILCFLLILVWAVSGPLFGFSDTWQLVINTGTTIITFNMVFLIQATQNRDGAAFQTKLDEILRAVQGADNRVIAIEEDEPEKLEAQREREREAKAEH